MPFRKHQLDVEFPSSCGEDALDASNDAGSTSDSTSGRTSSINNNSQTSGRRLATSSGGCSAMWLLFLKDLSFGELEIVRRDDDVPDDEASEMEQPPPTSPTSPRPTDSEYGYCCDSSDYDNSYEESASPAHQHDDRATCECEHCRSLDSPSSACYLCVNLVQSLRPSKGKPSAWYLRMLKWLSCNRLENREHCVDIFIGNRCERVTVV